jgi:hypothetical protein
MGDIPCVGGRLGFRRGVNDFLRDERGSVGKVVLEIIGLVASLIAIWEFGARIGIIPGLSPIQIGQEVVNEWPNWPPFDSNGGGGIDDVIDDGIELAPPGNLQESHDCDNAHLTWNPVEGAVEYQIRTDGAGVGPETSQTEYTIPLFKDGQTHNYQVVAKAFPVVSAPSDPVTIEHCSFT